MENHPNDADLLFLPCSFCSSARTTIMWLLIVVGEILGQKRKLAVFRKSTANSGSQITLSHCSRRKAILSDGTKTVILPSLIICE